MSTYIELPEEGGGGGGSGTVTSVQVTTANGVSGVVANPTTNANITLTLGAITPTSVNASGTLAGSNFSGSSSGTNTGDQTITLTGDVTGSGTGSFATTISAGAVANAEIANAAGIAVNKLAALTASRAVASDGSGFLTPATTTAAELDFVSGVTSNIQTQLNSKLGSVPSTDNAVPRFDGTGGNIQDSGVILDDFNNLSVPGSLTVTGTSSYVLFPSLTTVQRNGLTPVQGMVIYNSTVHTMQAYVAGTVNAWVDMLGWGAATS